MLRILVLIPALWIQFSLHAQGIIFPMDSQSVRARMVHDVAVLASDSLQGREAGTEGELKAARYLCSQFKAIGMLPKGEGTGSFYQRFSKFQVGYHWTTKLMVNKINYSYMQEFGVTALSMNGNGRGAQVDGMQGLVIPELDIDQLSGLGDLKGKFVMINLRVPDTLLRDTLLAQKLRPRNRMASVLEKGALGVIFWNPDSPWLSELFDFRRSDTLSGLALYINQPTAERLLKQSGSFAEINVQIDRNTTTYTNIIGFIDNHSTRTIVIGAHFDHLGMKKDGRIYYGADDNASGTAGMLELARYYVTHRDTLNNYLFIGFSGEEKGLFGSDYFVKHPTVPLPDVRYMLNLDMIGRLGCIGNTIEIEAVGSSQQWRQILHDTPHRSFNLKRVGASLPYSDHDPFYKTKIPVLFFTTGLHEDYHTVTDHPWTLNYN